MHQSQTATFNYLGKNRFARLLANRERASLYHYALVGVVFLAAAILRFYKLGQWSFWIDELYSLEAAAAPSLLTPVSTILMHLSLLNFTDSEWSLRLAPALVGLLSLPILYILVRKLFDREVGLIGMGLLAISPWHLHWSQNARFYTTLLLFYLVALVTFFVAVENRKRRFLFLSLAFLGLAMLERLFAAFLIPVVVCYLLLLRLPPFKAQRASFHFGKVLLAIVVVVVTFAFYDGYRLAADGDSIILSFLAKFVGNPNKSPWRFLASFVYRVGIPSLCLGMVTGFYLIKRKERLGLYLLVSAVLPPLALVLVAPFMFTADRYAFVALPGWIILAAVGIKLSLVQSFRRGQTLMLFIPLIIFSNSLVENTLYYEYQQGGRPDWQSAYALIRPQLTEEDHVFSTRPEIGSYYLGREVTGIADMDTALIARAGQAAWFVVNPEEVDAASGRWLEANGELVKVIDVHIPGKVYSVWVYRYDRDLRT